MYSFRYSIFITHTLLKKSQIYGFCYSICITHTLFKNSQIYGSEQPSHLYKTPRPQKLTMYGF